MFRIHVFLSYVVVAFSFLVVHSNSASVSPNDQNKSVVDSATKVCYAKLSATYVHGGHRNQWISQSVGQYGLMSGCNPEFGKVVHAISRSGNNYGCESYINEIPHEKWIALVKRGNCSFDDKVKYAIAHTNASAILVYDNHFTEKLITMIHNPIRAVSVFIANDDGNYIAQLVDEGVQVYLNISIDKIFVKKDSVHVGSSRQPPQMLTISLTVIVLLVISLCLLIAYALWNANRRKNDCGGQLQRSCQQHLTMSSTSDAPLHQRHDDNEECILPDNDYNTHCL